jgi:hypothetical protein
MTPPAAAAAPAVHPRRPASPRGPRRVSGPARPRTSPKPARSRAQADTGLALGLIGALEGLAQHRLIDRLIRGRVWIGIVAFALIGIVTLQLGLLRLNGGIGHALEHAAVLQRENAALSIENSEIGAGERIASRAAHLGMVQVPSGALSFLVAHPRSDAAKAAAALNSSARSSAQTAEAASATAASASGSSESQASESQASESSESSAGETSVAASSAPSPSTESSSGESERSATAGSEAATPASPESETASSASTGATPAGGTQASSSGE